jgi:MFS family permease
MVVSAYARPMVAALHEESGRSAICTANLLHCWLIHAMHPAAASFAMKSTLIVFAFIALTFFSWGAYGPVLHIGQEAMTGEDAIDLSRLRPFICVGLAYFVIAVVAPLLWLKLKGESGHWTASGTIWSVTAGAVGAIGALGIILAFAYRGNPLYVMPLVFGGAPVINTFTTMAMAGTYRQARPIFFVGLALVVAGAVTVLINKPHRQGPNATVRETDGAVRVAVKAGGGDGETKQEITTKITKKADGSWHVHKVVKKSAETTTFNVARSPSGRFDATTEKKGGKTTSTTEVKDEDGPGLKETDEKAYHAYVAGMKLYRRVVPLDSYEILMVAFSIGLTVLCWGAYGPVLHKGQMKMAGSRLRPLLCVGLAYMGIAVIVPTILLGGMETDSSFTLGGTAWSLAAGAAGAIGALGIIMAFNFGGKPLYVMPLVFGGAPVVNTSISIVKSASYDQIGTGFLCGLIIVIAGAVTVLITAPKPQPKKPS